MTNDLISRQAAIDAIGAKSDEIYKTKQTGATFPHDDFFQGMAYAAYIVKNMPSAQIGIIRCMDCIYWDTSPKNTAQPNYHECRYGIINHWTTTAEDYCSKWKRADG